MTQDKDSRNKDIINDKEEEDYTYNTYNPIRIKGKSKNEELDLDLQDYRDHLHFLASQTRRHLNIYLSASLWEEFNRVVKSVDPLSSRSQVLEKMIIEYCLRNNSRNLKITQFIFNQPKQVNIQQKVEINIAQKLELKLTIKTLTNILQRLENRQGDPAFATVKLRETLPKAIRIYEKTKSEELAQLLQKAEKWVENEHA